MTLTGLSADFRAVLRGESATRSAARMDLARRLGVTGAMLAGAVLSAWLVLTVSALSALSLATGLLAVVVIGAGFAVARPGAWRAAARA